MRMADTRPPLKFVKDVVSGGALANNLAMVQEIAETFRRVPGDESFDATGVRTVWHQGKLHTELLSWENKAGEIVAQELTMFGLSVEFKHGQPLRTGKTGVEDETSTAGGGVQKSAVLMRDPKPNGLTLDYASHLLRGVRDRDFYCQHLVQQVNAAIASLGIDTGRTQGTNLEMFQRLANQADESDKKAGKRAGGGRTWLFVGLAILAVAAGVIIGRRFL
jgi:hypothetical protein